MEGVAEACPDIRLCLSTNGLRLPQYADRIAELGVDHVTITINMTDPDVGAEIYPWASFGGTMWRGREAAKVLSEQQLTGLQMLTERGVLVKVNSVMIPGINDDHLVEVSRTVKKFGAFLHNVMPLVSAPEHGTVFGLAGLRGPTAQQVRELQDRCSADADADMNMMRHCRQCRADAVGMLGEDRSDEFAGQNFLDGEVMYDLEGRTKAHEEIERWREEVRASKTTLDSETAEKPEDTVLVAVATKGSGVVNQHFGHADEFWVYEAGKAWSRLVQTRSVERYCSGPSECGEPQSVLTKTVAMLSDCSAVLCSKVGPEPREALADAGIEVIETYDLIDNAVAAAGERLSMSVTEGAA
jgi:nitrogen fixation protein NifB